MEISCQWLCEVLVTKVPLTGEASVKCSSDSPSGIQSLDEGYSKLVNKTHVAAP